MVTTKHCCFGICRSDTRYGYRDHMKGVFFIPFPKPGKSLEKCQRWVEACKREGFTVERVTKDTYICSLHFVGGKGPTTENPDPVPATVPSPEDEQTAQKRKVSRYDDMVEGTISHRKRLLYDSPPPSPSSQEEESTDDKGLAVKVKLDKHSIEKVDQSSQTHATCEDVMKLKVEKMILKNELWKCRNHNVATQQKRMFSVDDVKNDNKQFEFYTGLIWLQFMTLWNFLGPARDELSYHKSSLKPEESGKSLQRKLDPINELFLTLIRLRTGLLHNDLAFRFGISTSLVSEIVTTWIQFMYLQFSTLKKPMFATREIVARNLPSFLKNFKGVRIIIDYAEFFVEQASNFEQHSSYQSHGTYKVLIGVSPTGAVMFMSDAYEESISDVEMVKQSGFLDHLEAGDLVLANRGFTIKDILAEKSIDLNVPPKQTLRRKLTPEEDIHTKKIARCVETSIERIKRFRLLSKVLPLSLQPVFSQMVFVAGCLVNFQEPLVTETEESFNFDETQYKTLK